MILNFECIPIQSLTIGTIGMVLVSLPTVAGIFMGLISPHSPARAKLPKTSDSPRVPTSRQLTHRAWRDRNLIRISLDFVNRRKGEQSKRNWSTQSKLKNFRTASFSYRPGQESTPLICRSGEQS